MEQMRIVKEMRERDRANGRTGWMVRPRYMVWENVPGAFSSNGGKDFQAVLTEICKIAEPECPDVPLPDKGKWSKSGALFGMGNDGCPFSVAWRVHDAQFWGVPQRRKRIALVADFGGLSAPEILFEREGLSGDSEPCGEAWQEAAGAAGGGVEGASGAMNPWDSQSARVYSSDGVWHSLNANENGGQSRDSVFCLQGNGIDRADTAGCNGRGWCEDVSYTLNTIDRPAVMAFAQNQVGEVRVSHMCGTLNTNSNASGRNSPLVYENHSQDSRYKPLGEVSETVSAKYGTGGNNQPLVVSGTYQAVTGALTPGAHPGSYNGQDAYNNMLIASVYGVSSFGAYKEGTTSLRAQGGDNGGGSDNIAVQNAIVRRLTPLECERLQGYPDGWTNIGEWVDSKGKKHKDADSPRYKALGNSIALPFWQWMFGRIVEQYPAERRDKLTLGSLFDGIGGFPLTAQRNGIEPVWASEIEEFPIAVTKRRFPDEPV